MRTVPIHALFAEDNVNPNEESDRHPREMPDAVLVGKPLGGFA